MLQPMPLLHVAESLVRVTTLDAGVFAFGVALLAATLGVVWVRPLSAAARGLRRRAGQRRLAIRVMSVLVFLAIVPSVLPYDHLWSVSKAHGDNHSQAEERVHASHCHGTPGSCADAPMTSGPGQFLTSEPLVSAPVMLSILILIVAPAWLSVTRRPEVPPPLFASSAA